MQVKMTVTVPFFNYLLDELASMADYYDRHPVQVIPQPGLPEEINRVWSMWETTDRVYAGLHSINDGNQVVYIRSSGNWILLDKSTCEITYSGRRHSLKELLTGLPVIPINAITGWQYYETREPDLAPWETTT